MIRALIEQKNDGWHYRWHVHHEDMETTIEYARRFDKLEDCILGLEGSIREKYPKPQLQGDEE
jgi:hypothetical protein